MHTKLFLAAGLLVHVFGTISGIVDETSFFNQARKDVADSKKREQRACGPQYRYVKDLHACANICLLPEYFDLKTQSCVSCVLKNSFLVESNPLQITNKDTVIPVYGHPQHYIRRCGNGGTILGMCNTYHIYDPDTESCVVNKSIYGKKNPFVVPGYQNLKTALGLERLPQCTREGVFEIPGSCTMFYRCDLSSSFIHGTTFSQTVFKCQGFRKFNRQTKECQILPTCYINQEYRDVYECPGRGFYRHPYDCQSYFYCAYNSSNSCFGKEKYTCPDEMVFNVCTEECEPLYNAKQCQHLSLPLQKELRCSKCRKENYCSSLSVYQPDGCPVPNNGTTSAPPTSSTSEAPETTSETEPSTTLPPSTSEPDDSSGAGGTGVSSTTQRGPTEEPVETSTVETTSSEGTPEEPTTTLESSTAGPVETSTSIATTIGPVESSSSEVSTGGPTESSTAAETTVGLSETSTVSVSTAGPSIETTTLEGSTQNPTELSTSGTTESPTETSTLTVSSTSVGPTVSPTESSTSEGSTESPTESPTSEGSTESPTESSTSVGPTVSPTESSTSEGTTESPTESSTSERSTESSTETQTSAASTQGPVDTSTLEGSTSYPVETTSSEGSTESPFAPSSSTEGSSSTGAPVKVETTTPETSGGDVLSDAASRRSSTGTPVFTTAPSTSSETASEPVTTQRPEVSERPETTLAPTQEPATSQEPTTSQEPATSSEPETTPNPSGCSLQQCLGLFDPLVVRSNVTEEDLVLPNGCLRFERTQQMQDNDDSVPIVVFIRPGETISLQFKP